jgi:D-glycero-D-manno-heptose 1,7-bisphosphate phosphatase
MYSALFLDRDGVIIENRDHYVRTWADVSFYPQALRALASIAGLDLKIVVVTNQSAVGRGIISLEQAEALNEGILDEIRQAGGRVDGLYMCPHAPADDCDCRKPMPGMFHLAHEDLDIDLDRAVMVGDAYTDLQAAQAAGVPHLVMVRTGRGLAQEKVALEAGARDFLAFETLEEAIGHLFDA